MAQIGAVLGNRYVEPTELEDDEAPVEFATRATPRRGWWPGIWAPRESWCDAKDFYDSEWVLQQRFERDWKLAVEEIRLTRLIVRATSGAFDEDDTADPADEVAEATGEIAEATGEIAEATGKDAEATGEGLPNVVHEVSDMLWRAIPWLVPTFDTYAAVSGSPTVLTFNEYTMLIDELQLHSHRYKYAKRRDLDRL